MTGGNLVMQARDGQAQATPHAQGHSSHIRHENGMIVLRMREDEAERFMNGIREFTRDAGHGA